MGLVPTHWTQRRLGYYLIERREKVSDKEFPALSVTKNGIVLQLETAAKTDDGDNRKRVCAGDFVINGRSDRKGSSGLSALDGSVSLINIVLQSQTRVDMKFIGWLLKSVSFQEEFYRYGKGIVADLWSTNFSEMRNILLAVPSMPEQCSIAAFLDHETAKIDVLVAEQERLIALLKEKRQAVISHAVTKGLDPNAPMKDSGVEWLGQVPAHWELRKVSQLFRAGKGRFGQMLTKEFCGTHEGDYPVYSGQTENDGVMGTWDQFEFDVGDIGVLFSTTVGAKAMHLRQLFGRFSLSQNCMIIWPTSDKCTVRFFYYHLQPLFQFQRALIPDHMQASFRIEDLYGYVIVLPPRDEQMQIVQFIDQETVQLDVLTKEADAAINLLKERRAALISAAVTGKIDVRGVIVVPAAEAA